MGHEAAPVVHQPPLPGGEPPPAMGPPVLLVHDDCGVVIQPVSHCSHCGERLRRDHVHVEPGPGNPDPSFLPARPAS